MRLSAFSYRLSTFRELLSPVRYRSCAISWRSSLHTEDTKLRFVKLNADSRKLMANRTNTFSTYRPSGPSDA
jgi:hypothetical protein